MMQNKIKRKEMKKKKMLTLSKRQTGDKWRQEKMKNSFVSKKIFPSKERKISSRRAYTRIRIYQPK